MYKGQMIRKGRKFWFDVLEEGGSSKKETPYTFPRDKIGLAIAELHLENV